MDDREPRLEQAGSVGKSGWRPREFAAAIGCSLAKVWLLVSARELQVVRIGRMTIITTPPREFLERKAAEQAAKPAARSKNAPPGRKTPSADAPAE